MTTKKEYCITFIDEVYIEAKNEKEAVKIFHKDNGSASIMDVELDEN